MNYKWSNPHYRLYYYSSGQIKKHSKHETEQSAIEYVKKYFGLKHSITTFMIVYWQAPYNDDVIRLLTYKDYRDGKY